MPSEDSSPVGSSCIFVFTVLERSDWVLMAGACAVLTNALAQTSFLLPCGKYLLIAFLFCSFSALISQGKPKAFEYNSAMIRIRNILHYASTSLLDCSKCNHEQYFNHSRKGKAAGKE